MSKTNTFVSDHLIIFRQLLKICFTLYFMNSPKPKLPKINEEERTQLVDALLEAPAWQQKKIDGLEKEIRPLKGEITKPRIRQSKKDKGGKSVDDQNSFKVYQECVIQDITFQAHNICYRFVEYTFPEGGAIVVRLPEDSSIQEESFVKKLIVFALYQYHHVTQPWLLLQTRDLGVDIMSGKLSHILTEDLNDFYAEKDELLSTGSVSKLSHSDDTGARHKGENSYCTYIGNELFAWFSSTESKIRINFLNCLSQGKTMRYTLNAEAIEYMVKSKHPIALLITLKNISICLHTAADGGVWGGQQDIIIIFWSKG